MEIEDTRKRLEIMGARIRKARLSKLGTRSKSKLGRLSGLSHQTIMNIERGERATSIAALYNICDALGIELKDVIA